MDYIIIIFHLPLLENYMFIFDSEDTNLEYNTLLYSLYDILKPHLESINI